MLAETPTCYSGYWGEGVCVPCPIGTYSESGINVCVPCEPGYYNDLEGQYQCTRCAQDEIAPSPGSTVCTWCSMLTYTIDNINCITKPTSLPTQLTPTENCNCESGYYCNDIRCVPCSRGSYWKPFHSGYPYGFCDSCPPGTFSDEESSTQCKSCPPGTVAPSSYSTYCSSCPAPSYTVDGITCVDPIVPIIPPPVPPIIIPPVPPSITCRDGTNEVAGICVPCEPGTFSTWGLKCYPCHPGYIAPDYGATICWRCVGNTISIKGIYCI